MGTQWRAGELYSPGEWVRFVPPPWRGEDCMLHCWEKQEAGFPNRHKGFLSVDFSLRCRKTAAERKRLFSSNLYFSQGTIISKTAMANYKEAGPTLFKMSVAFSPAKRVGVPEEVSSK